MMSHSPANAPSSSEHIPADSAESRAAVRLKSADVYTISMQTIVYSREPLGSAGYVGKTFQNIRDSRHTDDHDRASRGLLDPGSTSTRPENATKREPVGEETASPPSGDAVSQPDGQIQFNPRHFDRFINEWSRLAKNRRVMCEVR